MGRSETTGTIADINLRIELRRLAGAAAERGDGPLEAILGAAVRTLDERIAAMETEAGSLLPQADTRLISRNVRIGGHRTSVRLERDFWQALDRLAEQRQCRVNELCEAADRLKGSGSLTSALRVFILRSLER